MFGCLFGLIRRVGCLIFLLAAGFALYQWATWPDVPDLRLRNPDSTAFMERYRDRYGPEATLDWRWIGYDRISDHLKVATLVGEDINFFTHNGFAVEELKNAVQETVFEGEDLRGASTLSQQTVKNLWLSPSRNPWRKVKEALLTLQLEQELSKQRILEIYLNVAEFAPGVYGAEAASLRRFGRAAAALTPSQAAELAACLPSPSVCGSEESSSAYRERVERIQRRAAKADWLVGEL